MINVAIIDDQQIFREGLADLLQSDGAISCKMQYANGALFLADIEKPGAELPDIILLDLEMPVMNGIELNTIIQERHPGIKVIVLSMHANEKLIASLIKAGINGYLTKNCDKEELTDTVKTVYEKGFCLNEYAVEALKHNNHSKMNTLYNVNNIPIELSKREVEILSLICKEYSTAEIAAELFISQRTVEGHRNNLIQKTGSKNTAGLVLFALRNAIIKTPFQA